MPSAVIPIEINPQPVISVAPQEDELCFDGIADFDISTVNNPVSAGAQWRYDVQVTYPDDVDGTHGTAGNVVTLENLTAEGVAAFTDDLTNSGDIVRTIEYIFTPHILLSNGTTVCPGVPSAVIPIEINPQPVISVAPQEDELCFDGIADFDISTVNNPVSAGAQWRYDVQITYPDDVDGTHGTAGNVVTLTNLTAEGAAAFTDDLTNSGDIVRTVEYIFTPHILLSDGTTVCPGVSFPVDIEINPQPVIDVSPQEDELCFDGIAVFDISTLNIAVSTGAEWRYDVEIVYPEDITGEYGGDDQTVTVPGLTAEGAAAFTDQLNNYGVIYRTVQYRFTPYIVLDDGTRICPGIPTGIINIDINPEPVVAATPSEEILCNEGITDILLETPNVLTRGVVTFDYTATATGGSGGVTGFAASGSNLTDGYRIEDQLTNTTNEVQYVTYLITPRALEIGCADGETVTVVIAVNPTPVLWAETDETIVCDSTTITITVDDLLGNVLGSKVYELTTTNAGGNVTGVQASGEYASGTDISNFLVNRTNEVQEVTYRFRSRIKDPAGPGSGYCDDGTDTTIIISVNPTPLISVSIADTIYCDLSEITFEIEDLNGTVIGDKIYTLTTTYESGQVAGVQADGDYERINLVNNLQNLSNEVQIINYHFKAQIRDQRGPGTGYCSEGGDFSFSIYLNPTPIVTSSLLNDRDTICTNSLIEFELTSPTSVLDGVITFDYVATATGEPGDVTGFTPEINNMSQGVKIAQTLENHTNRTQFVTYRVTPMALSTGCAPGTPTDVVIRVNPVPIDSVFISQDVECHGSYTGELTVQPAIGSGPFDIQWTGPDDYVSDEPVIGHIAFGRYTVRVTDLNNCTASQSIRLSNPEAIAVNFSRDDVSCYGGSDGELRITTVRAGGGPPYSFEWSGPEGFVFEDNTVQNQSNLIAGQYTVVITDGKGCQYSSAEGYDPLNILKVEQPDSIIIEIDVTDATCDINDDGSATTTVTGGTPPYTYFWEAPEGYVLEDNSSPNPENMRGGLYTLWVTDANGCTADMQVEVGALPPFIVTPVVTTDYNGFGVSCFGASDAIVELNIIGEFPPFDFQWSNGSTEKDLVNVPAGEYHVHVLDAVNCPSEATVVITEPDEITMDYEVDDVSCFGYSDGQIMLDVNGGAGNLYYNWEDGQASPHATGLSAGEHFIRVSDINNCILDTLITVGQPEKLQTDPVVSEPYCDELEDGSIELNVTGGTFPYIFSWSGGQTSENIYNIGEGVYSVTIEDFNNCVLTDTIMVSSVNELCIRIPNAFTPNDDGHNDYWVIGSRVAGTLGELYPFAVVEVYNRAGELVYRSMEGYPEPWDGTSNGNDLPMDSYFYVIFRNNGQPPLSGHVTIIR
ncbi:MAG: PKD-like domain-containing protein [Bacteroidales bacterium]